MHPLRKFKEEQKELARKIRMLKLYRKEKYFNEHQPIPDELTWKGRYSDTSYLLSPDVLGRDYRHRHIAYCELRGRNREQIERKTRDDNKPDESRIQAIKDDLACEIEEYNKENSNVVAN